MIVVKMEAVRWLEPQALATAACTILFLENGPLKDGLENGIHPPENLSKSSIDYIVKYLRNNIEIRKLDYGSHSRRIPGKNTPSVNPQMGKMKYNHRSRQLNINWVYAECK